MGTATAVALVGTLTFTGSASAATCDAAQFLCGNDFSAIAGIEFDGQIATEELCTSTAPDTTSYAVDWGDGTPTTGAQGTCSTPNDPLAGVEQVAGSHTYAVPGTYTVTITDNNVLVNGSPAQGTATASVRQQSADVSLSMTAPSTASNGDNLIYAIRVSNAGIDPAHNVTMVDNLPYGTIFEAVTATGWSCSTPVVGKAGGTVTCSIDRLAAGTEVATSIGVKVKAHSGRGSIINSATVSTSTPDPNTSNNTATVSTTIVK